jgi:hypothetical protein
LGCELHDVQRGKISGKRLSNKRISEAVDKYGERIGRRELAELGHGELCMNCEVCKYPNCPFGKGE